MKGLLKETSDQQDANAAVGILLKPIMEDFEVLFVKRVERKTDPWSGQIAFPGGKYDPEDNNLKDTVIREIFEETGINLQEDSFLGVLEAVESKPKRNIKILPFIAFLKKRPVIKLNENELDKYFWIPYRKIVSSIGVANLNNRNVPAYFLEEEIVWGVTYRILGKFNEIINSLSTKQ